MIDPGFALGVDDLIEVGGDLSRPECVLTTASGDLYASDSRGGVSHIASDGTVTHFHGRTPDGVPLGSNGFAMLQDGSFLIAPLCGGGVYQLWRDGRARPYLSEVDGVPLACPNFVLLDTSDRIWVCALTRSDRSTLALCRPSLRDGYIVLIDRSGARIVAEGIGYPNEVRVDPTGRYLYVNETLAANLLRFPIGPGGALGASETIAELPASNLLDGFTLDAASGAWITSLISNRLWHVDAAGVATMLLEEAEPAQIARLEAMKHGDAVPKSLIYEEHGSRLRNISSVAFGGPDLRTVYLGNLMGDRLASFRAPVQGMRPAHWHFGPFGST